MKRRTSLLSLFLAGILLPTTLVRLQAQQSSTEQPAKLEVEKVVLDFQIMKKGEFVRGLKKQDLSVYEDDAKQEITQFSEGDPPLSIVLLLDLSNSMRKSVRYVRESAQQIAQGFNPDDEVALMTFAIDVVLAQPFTRNKQQIANGLGQVPVPAGYTMLNKALKEAATYSAKSATPGNRRVIIAFTDDEDTAGSTDSLNQASHAIFSSGIVVCGFIVRVPSRVFYPTSEGGVAKLVRQTGGVPLFVDERKLGEQMAGVVRLLHRHYVIEYVPSNAKHNGKFRRIRLRLSPDVEKREGKLDILAREGYYAPTR
ncbi:MAG: VWA domain-containing protein [Acidobacteriota bacterium]